MPSWISDIGAVWCCIVSSSSTGNADLEIKDRANFLLDEDDDV
jgi:hypothetical protein